MGLACSQTVHDGLPQRAIEILAQGSQFFPFANREGETDLAHTTAVGYARPGLCYNKAIVGSQMVVAGTLTARPCFVAFAASTVDWRSKLRPRRTFPAFFRPCAASLWSGSAAGKAPAASRARARMA
jgi:hypothetical protein